MVDSKGAREVITCEIGNPQEELRGGVLSDDARVARSV
jgi:hypothetical protein